MSVVHDPTFRQRLRFTRRPGGDGGEETLFVEIWIDPGGGVTPHVHPSVHERFRVVAGTAQFLPGRAWRSAGPGEEVVVPAGRRHAYRNRGDQVAYITCDVTPPSTVQEFLESIAALSSAGMLTRRGLPRSPAALVEAGAVAWAHRDMLVLGFPPLPPWPVQRLVLPLLARIHKEEHHASDR
jgi:mannose-6-phosphate isomerase-like protein (cupin superfamily)